MKKIPFLTLSIINYSFLYSQNVGIGTTTPIARLHVADSNVVFTGPASIPNITNYGPPVQGVVWYTQKAAFSVGSVDAKQWDKNNIGRNSFVAGSGKIASGNAAVAVGNATLASGISSTATGNATQATATFSTAMGVYYCFWH